MKEYQITVYTPAGEVYFATEWMLKGGKAEFIAMELGELFGVERMELVERTLSRGGYTYRTLLETEVAKA
jgi:hypothetical protein